MLPTYIAESSCIIGDEWSNGPKTVRNKDVWMDTKVDWCIVG